MRNKKNTCTKHFSAFLIFFLSVLRVLFAHLKSFVISHNMWDLTKTTAVPTRILQSSSSCRWTEGSSTPCPCQAMTCLTVSQCTLILICTSNQTIYSSFFKLLYCYKIYKFHESNLL